MPSLATQEIAEPTTDPAAQPASGDVTGQTTRPGQVTDAGTGPGTGTSTDSHRPPMAAIQGATPPAWLGRPWWRLLGDAIGGVRRNFDKLVHLVALLVTMVRPRVVRARLERLRALGHLDGPNDPLPTLSQLLVAARDQMMLGAAEETKIFYRSQGIPWVFHNVRRFLAGPATMMDPMGLFSPRDALVHHVLQTFHRHPLYDFVLLRAHPRGVEEMHAQTAALLAGKHPHGPALLSLIEDGSYHARLPRDLAAFEADPHAPPRPLPPGLVDDPLLMAAMDQFKDMRGYVRYAVRLPVGPAHALWAWLAVAFDETIGQLAGKKLSPGAVDVAACDPDIVARHLHATG